MTYWPTLKTIRAKVVMFGIKPKLMKGKFEATYFYDLLTYLKTIGIKQNLQGRFELTYFHEPMTCLK
jgi:hypothetical protein